MKRSIIPKLSPRAIAINAGAGLIMVTGFISFVHAKLAPPHFEVCSTRYHRQVTMRLDRDGTVLTPNDIQAVSNGQDEGVLDNLTIAQFNEGPVKFGMGVKLAQDTVEQRSNRGLPGGISLPWMPSVLEQPTAACLTYNIFLPADFVFGEGGTLPGLFGTTTNGQYGDAPNFGTNLAWHAGGAPKFHMQVKADSDNRAAAFGTFDKAIPRGRWVRVEQELILNVPGQPNGIARLWFDGRLETEVKSVDIRPAPDVSIAGVSADVYFGGSGTTGKAAQEATVWLSPFELRWN